MATTGVSHGGPARADQEAARRRDTTHGDHRPRQSHFWLVMTFNMAVGMVTWRMTVAMSATAVSVGMFWLHIVSEEPLIGLMHVLMLPAMLIAMLSRREEYSYAHR